MKFVFSSHLVNSDSACVTFRSYDGRSIKINKYFLFLYDAFYKSILEDNMEESLVFIFEGATFDELILYRDQVHQKHLQCVDHSQSQISEGRQTITEYKTDTEPEPNSDSTYDDPEVSEHRISETLAK